MIFATLLCLGFVALGVGFYATRPRPLPEIVRQVIASLSEDFAGWEYTPESLLRKNEDGSLRVIMEVYFHPVLDLSFGFRSYVGSPAGIYSMSHGQLHIFTANEKEIVKNVLVLSKAKAVQGKRIERLDRQLTDGS